LRLAADAWYEGSVPARADSPLGKSVPRREDERFLRGQGRFVADIELEGMVEAAVLRSPFAHARIVSVDASGCRADPRTIAVLTAADVPDVPTRTTEDFEATTRPFVQPILARDVVRYVGEPIALVVASDRYEAEDLLALIEVSFEPLPVLVDPEEAAAETSEPLHEDTNLADVLRETIGDTSALDRAPHRLRARFTCGRHGGMPIETRGVIGSWDAVEELLTVWSSTQVPHNIRWNLERLLGMPRTSIRVVAPDVGGGFGTKLQIYPEEVLVSLAALRLKRPVRWIEDRWEHFLATTQGREQIHELEVGFDDAGVILAARDRILTNTGAYLQSTSLVEAFCGMTMLRGPYRIPNYEATSAVVVTNKTPMNPFRGVGHVQAAFVMERTIDMIARRLDLDPAEVRLRNVIQPDELPIHRGGVNVWSGHFTYDSGDYPQCLRKALELARYEEFRIEQRRLRREEGRYIGIGIGCYVEITALGPYEGASVRVDETGHVAVACGAGPCGQGTETTLAQIAADELHVPVDRISVRCGDTDVVPYGVGTYASRMATVGGSAVRLAAHSVHEKALLVAADMLEALPADLRLDDGRIFVAGSRERAVTLGEVAKRAAPGRRLPAGVGSHDLAATEYFHPEANTFSYGTQIAVVEVDPETGLVHPLRVAVVGDCGTVVNPTLVDGQYQGGISMGIGGAFLEEVLHDEDGQPQNPSFMDYLMPSGADAPQIVIEHMSTPSLRNPDGIKGVGEGGAIGAPAALANAVADALSPFGVEIVQTPMTPDRIRGLVAAASAGATAPVSAGA
jgi:aerobic carbon-monoxide dehydrogenase large subunit